MFTTNNAKRKDWKTRGTYGQFKPDTAMLQKKNPGNDSMARGNWVVQQARDSQKEEKRTKGAKGDRSPRVSKPPRGPLRK